MKYIAQPDGSYAAYDESSEAFKLLNTLPKDRRPVFIDEKDAGVMAYFAKQAEAAKAFEAKQANKKSALEKLAKVAGLTDDELAALE